ncbi:MAG: hypothetical protein ACREOK_10205 [Gemmatimonadaceae bacterium]
MAEEPELTSDVATRRLALIRELTIRLRPTCADWPDELFTAMVERLADITIKYSGHASISTYDRRSSDRLIADLKDALARSEATRDRPDSTGAD